MAFRVLSVEEVKLLTVEQQKSYEKELTAYNERVKFVEQAEKLENIVLEPFEPKFVSITVAQKAPERKFVSPEFDLTKAKAPERKISKPKQIGRIETVRADIPAFPKVGVVDVEQIKTYELETVKLPGIESVRIPDKVSVDFVLEKPELPEFKGIKSVTAEFKMTKVECPMLPVWKRAVAPKTRFEKVRHSPVIPNIVKVQSPKTAFERVEFPNFKVPTFKKADVPKSSYKKISYSAPTLPQLSVVKAPKVYEKMPKWEMKALPNFFKLGEVKYPSVNADLIDRTVKVDMQKPNIASLNFPKFTSIESSKAVLPKVNVPEQVKADFKHVDRPNARIPEFSKAVCRQSVYKKPKLQKAYLPTIQRVLAPKVKFSENVVPKSAELPHMQILTESIKAYTAPKISSPNIPNFNKVPVFDDFGFVKPDIKLQDIKTPDVNLPNVKSIEIEHPNIGELPKFIPVVAPDVYADESLKPFLLKKGSGELRKEAVL